MLYADLISYGVVQDLAQIPHHSTGPLLRYLMSGGEIHSDSDTYQELRYTASLGDMTAAELEALHAARFETSTTTIKV